MCFHESPNGRQEKHFFYSLYLSSIVLQTQKYHETVSLQADILLYNCE